MRTVSRSIVFLMFFGMTGIARAFTVFACEPEWAALTLALYPKAQIFSATNHLQDPHHIEARPSLIARLRQADLAICTGAGLEAGWLPTLQARAGNPKVQDGQPGMFYAAKVSALIHSRPSTISPFSGDVHADGNPHIHADPHRLRQVARALRDRLVQLRQIDAGDITAAHADFDARLSARINDWERLAAPLKGKAIVVQHSTFDYLWSWLQISRVADLEPKPGMSPTPGHLERIQQQVRQSPVSAIVIAEHHDRRPAEWLARQEINQKLPLLVLPATVTEVSASALIDWLDGLVTTLRKQLQSQ